jgi:hypothetical protein
MDASDLAGVGAGVGTGWLALALIGCAAAVPLGYRLRVGSRAAPQSRATSIHVAIGVATALAAFSHGLVALMSLGSGRAITAGNLGLAAGAGALLVLMAHVGVGLQLRDPKLKKRPEKRRTHLATAITITVLALAHLFAFWNAG